MGESFLLVGVWALWVFCVLAVVVPPLRVSIRGNSPIVESWGVLGRGMRRGALYVSLSMLAVCSIYLARRVPIIQPEYVWPLIEIFAVVAGVSLIALALVVLWNRPRFLVPPSFRDQPGAIYEWLDRGKKS